MSDERSERLRRNRNRAKERAQSSVVESAHDSVDSSTDSDEQSKLSKRSKPSEQSQPSRTAESDETTQADHEDEPSETSVKEERVGTYMYLPESQQSELRRLYNVLKADYEYEYDTEFEKNRHFYPLVIEFGVSGLDGSDASDIRTKLDGLDI